MKKNTIITACVAIGVVVIGVGGLIIGMNKDWNNQSTKMESRPLDDVMAQNAKDEEELAKQEVDTAETGTQDTSKMQLMEFDGMQFYVESAGNIDDDAFEIPLKSAVDIGLTYVKDNYSEALEGISFRMETTSASGIKNGSVAWYEVIEMNDRKRYEITINSKTGEVLDAQAYYKEKASDERWVNASASSTCIQYKVEKLNLDAFSKIDVDIDYNASVEMVTGDSYGVIFNYYGPDYEIEYKNENGELTINDIIDGKVEDLMGQNQNNYVTIIVPKDSKLSEIDIVDMRGDISMKAIQVDKINTLALNGDSTFVEMVVKEGLLQTSAGDINVKDMQGTDVELVTINGDIVMNGKINSDWSYDATSEKVIITSTETEEKYSYCLSNKTGKIIVNGKNLAQEQDINKTVEKTTSALEENEEVDAAGNTSTGAESILTTETSNESKNEINKITATTISGDVELEFDKEVEKKSVGKENTLTTETINESNK
ncbi:DUF4097 family beta strand repeat-containing protein [Anaerosporobacter sp.]|uniref:DUF4097 family beta strand repeat-containing protein n=1 Tax=Anaerosporobacter sp. TaxID=1872529 RepID=UPI00286F5C88|nr:DUF4097 family beta strand repeat-containing protein [Anaerosporobacter sp.]